MRELSLFTGAGGGLLATRFLLGWDQVGYVEIDEYCQRVLRARIDDGYLAAAPIFTDIRAFNASYARRYRGLVDVITAGFPCQPFSVAGKQKGADDERNMWPATARAIELVAPGSVLLENVPGIRKYLPVVVRDLRRLGYKVERPLRLGACDVGAPHQRKRIWILANATCIGRRGRSDGNEAGSRRPLQAERPRAGKEQRLLAHAQGERLEIGQGRPGNHEQKLPAFERTGYEWWRHDPADFPERWNVHNADGGRFGTQEGEICTGRNPAECAGTGPTEPFLGRVAHGVAYRVDRLKALGNGQVSAVVSAARYLLGASR